MYYWTMMLKLEYGRKVQNRSKYPTCLDLADARWMKRQKPEFEVVVPLVALLMMGLLMYVQG